MKEDIVIVALGHNSKMFDETAWLPLQSLRGQVSYLTPTSASAAMTHVICHEGFVTPLVNGLHYAGATFQKEEPGPPEVRTEDHQENLSKLNAYLPSLGFSDANIAGGRTGYRTTTPDKLPMMGVCPDYRSFVQGEAGQFLDNIYLSTGFGAHGLIGAPLAGEVIASMIAGDPLPLSQNLLAYLAPERFILRDLKRGKI